MVEGILIEKIKFLISDECIGKSDAAKEIKTMVDSLGIHDIGKARIKEEIDIYVLEPTPINRDNIIFALEVMKQ